MNENLKFALALAGMIAATFVSCAVLLGIFFYDGAWDRDSEERIQMRYAEVCEIADDPATCIIEVKG